MALRDKVEAANRRGRGRQQSFPRASSARYDARRGRVVIRLGDTIELSFVPHDAEGLEGASSAQLNPIEISPSGLGIHFPKLDADIYLPALLEGVLGSKKWMASRMGAAGGKSRSTAKTAAARSNGKLGGRPRRASTDAVLQR